MVTRFEDGADGVTVMTEDGRSFRGALLIGADGIRSRMRAQIVRGRRASSERLHGLSHHRADGVTSPRTCSATSSRLWAGPGFHIVHYPLRHGTLFNIVAVFRRSAHSERGDTAAYRAELEGVYRNAHPTMKALLAMLDLGRRQAIGDRDPIRHWHKGRVVLLGDAAHPTLQSLAQGACMAIEDGLCLADCIDGGERRLRSGLPALRKRPLGAHRAGDARIPLPFGTSIMPTASRGKSTGRCWASAAKPTPSSALPGCTTASACRNSRRWRSPRMTGIPPPNRR